MERLTNIMLLEIFAAVLIGQVPQSNSDLQRFAGLDLGSLSQADKDVLKKLRDRLMPADDLNLHPKLIQEWVKPVPTGVVRYLFVDFLAGTDKLASGFVKGCCLDEHLDLVASFRFSTGYLLDPRGQSWIVAPTAPSPVLQIKLMPRLVDVSSSNTRVYSRAGVVESYGFDTNGPHLIRLEDGRGRLFPNNYTDVQNLILPDRQTLQMTSINYVDIGPSIFGRSASDWKVQLNGDDLNRQLEALVWLAGRHRSSPDNKNTNLGQESPEDDNTFKTLVQDADVVRRIRELAESTRPWIRDQAAFTLQRMTRI